MRQNPGEFIGVLTDMWGGYSDISGPGAVEAAKMAVEDFGGKVLGMPIEVVSADHQNKADVPVGLLQDHRDDPWRRGISPPVRDGVSHGEMRSTALRADDDSKIEGE